MKRLMSTLMLSLLLTPLAAPALVPVADDAVFVEGARYNAVLDARAGAWRLLPAEGPELRLRVSGRCLNDTVPPPGLWLLSHDDRGRPELVAVSSTPLPAGHPGRVAMVDCGPHAPLPGSAAIAVPPGLMAWLNQHSGSIYVAP